MRLAARACWGSYSAPPDSLAVIRGMGREGWKGRDGKRKECKEGGSGWGRDGRKKGRKDWTWVFVQWPPSS